MEQNHTSSHPIPEKAPKNVYSPFDAVFALISLFFGYAMFKTVFSSLPGIGMLLITAVSVALLLIFFVKYHVRLKSPVILLPISAIVFSVAPFLSGSYVICILSFMYSFFAVTLSALLLTGNSAEKFLGDASFFDLIKSVFIMPFIRYLSVFTALSGLFKKKKIGKTVLFIFLGILLAMIPTLIITLLLASDAAFSNLLQKIGSGFGEKLLNNIGFFLLGLPISAYFFSALYANGNHLYPELLDKESSKSTSRAIAICPSLILYVMLTPILLVYVIYFIAQFSYFTSAFSSLLPENFTYADYARNGFFELCAVSLLNAIILLCANLFSKRTSEDQKPKALRFYTVLTSFFTLILISTAISKMLLYIGAYGLTPLRVYTTWFMILLAVIFLLTILRQFFTRFNAVIVGFVCFLILFTPLCFSDPDARIAQYNVALYTSGKTDTLDVELFDTLGNGAVEYLMPLANDKNPQIQKEVTRFLSRRKQMLFAEDRSLFSFNLATIRAKELLSGYRDTAPFYLSIENKTEDAIFGYYFEYYLDGEYVGSSTIQNADSSQITEETLQIEITPEDLQDRSDFTGFSFECYVILNDKKILCLDMPTEIAAESAMTFSFTLTGSEESGFSLISNDTGCPV